MTNHSITRRQALRAAGLAGATLIAPTVEGAAAPDSALAATDRAATLTPELTEGPYWVNTMLHRHNVVANTDGSSRQRGVPMDLYINVREKTTDQPMNGLAVDIWHANADGIYSDESSQSSGGGVASSAEDTISDNFLRGYQITGQDPGLGASAVGGQVSFRTIWPGWYTGRTIHIHVRVRKLHHSGATIAGYTTQICFDQDLNDHVMSHASPYRSRDPVDDPTTNRTDTVINSADFATNIIRPKGSVEAGYTAVFTIIADHAEVFAAGSLARPSSGAGGAPPATTA